MDNFDNSCDLRRSLDLDTLSFDEDFLFEKCMEYYPSKIKMSEHVRCLLPQQWGSTTRQFARNTRMEKQNIYCFTPSRCRVSLLSCSFKEIYWKLFPSEKSCSSLNLICMLKENPYLIGRKTDSL